MAPMTGVLHLMHVIATCGLLILLTACGPSQRVVVSGPASDGRAFDPETCFTSIFSDGIGLTEPVTTEAEALDRLERGAREGLQREKVEEVPASEEAFYPNYYEVTAQARVDAFADAEATRVAEGSTEGFSVYEAYDPDGALVARYELQFVEADSNSGWVVVREAFRKPPEVCARDAKEGSEAASEAATVDAANDPPAGAVGD